MFFVFLRITYKIYLYKSNVYRFSLIILSPWTDVVIYYMFLPYSYYYEKNLFKSLFGFVEKINAYY